MVIQKPSPRPKKLLRASKATVADAKKPQCKIHTGFDMVYVVAEACWKCGVAACTQKSYPKASVEEDGKPIVGKGALELLKYTDSDNVTNFVLRAVDNNVCLDVTDLVISVRQDPFNVNPVLLTLNLKRYATTDGFGNKSAS